MLVITKQPSSRKSHGDPHAHVTYFNVDLLRLRALEEIRAEELHDTGAMALAQDLKLEQCCLKLLVGPTTTPPPVRRLPRSLS